MNPNGLPSGNCMGMNLSIGGVALQCAAWQVLDLTSLWEPSAVRGNDRVVPGIEGVIPYPIRKTVTSRSLPMVIVGGVDRHGNPQVEDPNPPYGGLQWNIDYLVTNLVAPVGGDGTRRGELVMPDTSTRYARVTVLGLTIGQHVQAGMLATLDIRLPTGRFE